MAYDMYKREKVNGIDNLIFPLLDVTYSQVEIMMISQYYYMVKKGRFSSFVSINSFITMDTEKSRHICRDDDDDQRTVKLILFTKIKPQILFTHSVLTRHFQKTAR